VSGRVIRKNRTVCYSDPASMEVGRITGNQNCIFYKF